MAGLISVPRALLVLLMIGATLSLVDEAVLATNASIEVRQLVSAAAVGGMVFLLAFRGGNVLRFVMRKASRVAALGCREEMISLPAAGARLGRPPRITVFRSDKPVVGTVCEGRHCRIFVSEMLLGSLSSAALEGVLTHECGHVAMRHPLRMAVVLGALATVKMWIGVPLLAVPIVVLAYLWLSRHWEFEADAYAADSLGVPRIVETFAEYRRISGYQDVAPWLEILCTDPRIAKRVEALQQLAQRKPWLGRTSAFEPTRRQDERPNGK